MTDCLFCRIVEGRELSYKIAESRNFVAILNIFPSAAGHTLIIPKNHSVNLLDLPENNGVELLEFTQRVAQAVMSAVGADGFNFGLNNGEAAGQSVLHTHFHILPRKRDDGLHSSFDSGHSATPEELRKQQKDILSQFDL